MQKGQKVKCVSTTNGYLTVGKTYPVLAGEGDRDLVFINTIIDVSEGFNIECDNGSVIYAVMDGAHGRFELVDDGGRDA